MRYQIKNAVMLLSLVALSACVEPDQKINIVTNTNHGTEVTPPACPDWTKTNGLGNPSNTVESNYTCASISNFGMMIDDPNDMITGKHGDLTNGARSGLAVTQYETETIPAAAAAAPSASSGAGQ